jgi:hypothetical protein
MTFKQGICAFLVKKFSCIGSVLIGAAQIVAGSILTGLVSSVVAITNLFTNSSCDCGSTSCFTLSGISMFRDDDMDCAGNLVKFCAFGDGPSPSSFTWTTVELDQFDQPIIGTLNPLPNTPDRCANFSPDANLSKKIRLTITAFSSCIGQNATKFFDFTWGDIVGNPGTVIISGSSDVLLREPCTYTLNGTCLLNRKNSTQWFIPSQATLTSGGGSATTANVTWNARTCPPSGYCPFRPSIWVRSTNSCSNAQQTGSLNVGVR